MANVGGPPPRFRRNRTGAVAAETGRRRCPIWLWLLLALLALLLLAWLLYALLHKTHKKHTAAPKPVATVTATPGVSSSPTSPPTPASASPTPSSPASTTLVPAPATGAYGPALVGGGALAATAAQGIEAAPGSAGGSNASTGGSNGSAASGPQGTVLFASGSAALDTAALQVISNAATRIKALHPAAVMVTGYTDVVGGQPKNDNLSLRRANAVATVLRRDLGATPSVTANAKGEADPIAPNSTAAGRQENRRASITAN